MAAINIKQTFQRKVILFLISSIVFGILYVSTNTMLALTALSRETSLVEENNIDPRSTLINHPTDPKIHALGRTLRNLWTNMMESNSSVPAKLSRPVMIGNFLVPPSEYRRSKSDVTLVTHGSASKLDRLSTLIEKWNGPASVGVYLTSLEDVVDFQTIYAKEEDKTFANVSFHLIMEHKTRSSKGYPHNWLRNLALDHCGSDYFVALDGDFIPPQNAYRNLRLLLKKNKDLRRDLQKLYMFVLPAFEVFAREGKNYTTQDQLPSSKEHLHKLVLEGKAEAFHINRYWEGHGPTNSTKWFEQSKKTDFYDINYVTGYEPYVLGYRPGIPRYWNEFRGYGSNKRSWFKELDRAGYKFRVLNHFYVVHMEHPSTLNHSQLDVNLAEEENFHKYLFRRYPSEKRSIWKLLADSLSNYHRNPAGKK